MMADEDDQQAEDLQEPECMMMSIDDSGSLTVRLAVDSVTKEEDLPVDDWWCNHVEWPE
jgi:hypothetical protein